MKLKPLAMALAAACAVSLTACGGGSSSTPNTGGNGGNGSSTVEALPLSISTDTTLDATKVYEIDGNVTVAAGATLTIPAGTKLYGKTGSSYLSVDQGGKIMAEGTASAPIIFSSKADYEQGFAQEVDSKAAQGQWGGLSIFGKATTNKGIEKYEAGDHTFGCDDQTIACDDADNSGVLRYVVIKHTGFEVETDKELNGLSLGGVGSGTTIENVAVLGSADDGIEIWGGKVQITSAYIYNAADDSLDWDHGWTGGATNVYAEQSAVDGTGSRGMETDNNGGSVAKEQATPVSNPTVTKFTIKTAVDGGQGIVNREGTAGDLSNGLIQVGNPGKACIEVRSATTAASGLRYDDIACVQSQSAYYKGHAEDANDDIFGDVTDAEVEALVTNGVTQTSADGITGKGADLTAFSWVENFLVSSAAVETLPNSITGTKTLSASKVYEINGVVRVEDGATLNIPAGTKLYGATGSSYLAVKQGGKINATGTADKPVIFTSKADFLAGFNAPVSGKSAQGQWGGVSIFGKATTNKGIEKYEAGDFNFGCDDATVACNDADNSGKLNYVILKHTGFEVETDKELNGLSLGGVGSGTQISNVASVAGSDDGIEIWGGAVQINNAYIFNASDDSLDWDHGWHGGASNVYIQQDAVDGTGSRGMETDNNGGSTAKEVATPVSNPTIENYTIKTVAEGGQGIVNREGTAGQLTNGLVEVTNTGKGCIEVRSANTIASGLAYTNLVCVQPAGVYFKGHAEDANDDIFGDVTDAQVAAIVGGDVQTVTTEPADVAGKGADKASFSWVETALGIQ
ncbi:MAG: hypothetical protein ACWA5X_05760 [bacterium]